MSIQFISDLHLQDGRPGITRILLNYLQTEARKAESLYLLGDIFEYWLGDDVSLPRYQQVCDALADVSYSGTHLYFMRGNRDFMVDGDFSRHTGARMLEDPHPITLNGTPALLSHGDLLCTDDIKHQDFRRLVSQPEVRARLSSLPAEQREQMALQLRRMSKSNASTNAMDIMDVTQTTVEQTMREHQVSLLIHGHTHRCAMHEYMLDGQPARRVVLADWHEDRGSVLVCDDDGFRFEDLT